MPLDFPNSPVDGDTFTSTGKVWVYVAAINAWEPKPQAVAWDDLTGTLDSVQFDLTPTTDTFSIGETKWNAAEGCLSYGVEGGDISIGKEIWENYTDLDGDMVEGDVVSVVGASGNRSAVRKTNATSATSAAAVLGIVTNVNADNTVRVTEFGRVHKLNTGGYVESALLYVNPAANGKWTDVKPTAPNYAVEIGVVEVAHAVNGVIAARCRSVTFPSANIIDLPSATVGALSFGATTEAVSMSAIAGVATFTFGTNAKAAFLAAVGAMASTGGTMTNGTISGTVAVSSGSAWTYADQTAKTNHLTSLGFGAAGKEIATLTTPSSVNQYLGERVAILAADETGKTDTTLVKASGLTIPVEADKTYKIELNLIYTSNGGHLTAELRIPSGAQSASATNVGVAITVGGVISQGRVGATAFPVSAFGGSTTGSQITSFFYVHIGSTGGDMELWWAQTSANANASVLKARSSVTAILKN